LRDRYEKYHGVKISDEVIETTVRMSDRYISERFMPDKAIDVIDEAAALMSVRLGVKPSKARRITKQIKDLNNLMDEAVVDENYEKAALYKTQISQLTAKLDETRKETKQKKPLELTDDDIARAIALITGIPVQRLQKSELQMLQNLEKHLSKYIIGQDEALAKVSSAIRRGRSGVSNANRPIGSFIFMGPTGVGKTELAKVLAREVFGSEKLLIKIDMSEFGEKHNTARLLGAPAGYVGYEDGGQLTDKIRRQPYSVVLFDEIEKAHRDVLNLLLQVLEDGYLTDSKGRQVDFTNTIVILTSNLGSKGMTQESELGFHATTKSDERKLDKLHEANTKTAMSALEDVMRVELINRFDDVIVFRALTLRHVGQILNRQIAELQERLISKGLHLVFTPAAKKLLIKKGYSEKYGARSLRRVMQTDIEHNISNGILSGKFEKGSVLLITAKKGEIEINVSSENK
jgi:ATP-dependent Clp protease ATP-binding subunit ClpC